MAERKPVALVTKPSGHVIAVCDDGSTWMEAPGGWQQMPSIPGTKAAADERRANLPNPGRSPK